MYILRISVILLATPTFAKVLDHREDPQPTLTPQYAKRYLYNSDQGQKATEAIAWKDQLTIAKEAAKYKAGEKWKPMFDKYMGKDSKYSPWGNAIKCALIWLVLSIAALQLTF